MNNHFEGFPHAAEELSAYIYSIDTFVLSLKDSEELVRFIAPQPQEFEQWLIQHNIRNVNATLGKMVYAHYFGEKLKVEK